MHDDRIIFYARPLTPTVRGAGRPTSGDARQLVRTYRLRTERAFGRGLRVGVPFRNQPDSIACFYRRNFARFSNALCIDARRRAGWVDFVTNQPLFARLLRGETPPGNIIAKTMYSLM